MASEKDSDQHHNAPSCLEDAEGFGGPHYLGHRQRLKERFHKNGSQALSDYELLELLLFTVLPRRDTKPLAKALLQRFGGFNEVINAPWERLREIKGVGHAVYLHLRIVKASAERMVRSSLVAKPVIASWSDLIDYCHMTMAYEEKEVFRIVFLNKGNRIIADEVQQTGTVDQTPVYPREVIKRALDLAATAIILVHNHPSGSPKPSTSDISITHKIIEIAQSLGIKLHDHVIIAKDGHLSFRNSGLI